jgi:regulator of sigma E protease
MVGEGPEADEDEDYPRSFKNKTVGQRMLIISAGVVMNVLVGCLLFVIVYMYHGVQQAPAVVGWVDAGSPVWEHGIRSGTVITSLGGIRHPYFDDLRKKVMLSQPGQTIPFTFETPGGSREEVDLLPRRNANDAAPIVGLAPPSRLRLPEKPRRPLPVGPVQRDSAAAAARPLPLEPGEVVVASTDPDHPDRLAPLAHDLSTRTWDSAELARRLTRLAGQKAAVRVLPAGARSEPQERELPLVGFDWGDVIVGSTAAEAADAKPYDPYRVTDIPPDPRDPGDDHRDPFEFHRRLVRLAGLPMVILVRRQADPGDDAPVPLFVPPAYHTTFGMRMKMGKVAGVRRGSSAEAAGLRPGDELINAVMTFDNGAPPQEWEDLDPERLPFQLARAAAAQKGKKRVALTVRRPAADTQGEKLTLGPAEWDASWDADEELPQGRASPLPVPQLGLAYWVNSQVAAVEPGWPAAEAGLEKGDRIDEVRFKDVTSTGTNVDWSGWFPLESQRGDETVYDRWAHVFWILQLSDFKEVQLRVSRPKGEVKNPVELRGRTDETWPLASRGLRLQAAYYLQKANSLGEALEMGAQRTAQDIVSMYLQLRSLLNGRLSARELGGPIAIFSHGVVAASMGFDAFLLLMAVISINLAVVNFLPIPVLDGGHMVLLIYEKVRGRPPSESARAVATWIGLAAIASLMVFVFYQDIRRYFFGR